MRYESPLWLAVFTMLGFGVIGSGGSAIAQTEVILYSFSSANDTYPEYLLLSDGSLFGTTIGSSGAHDCCGNVYELAQLQGVWTFASLYEFKHSSGGKLPNPGLAQDGAGMLYGTTYGGGTYRRGTVFELSDTGGTPDFIWNFEGGKHFGGVRPVKGNLVMDATGSIYGEAGGGTHKLGVIFELTRVGGTWTETALYSFKGGADGAAPIGGLLMDAPGSLWGVTEAGGASCDCGTVFHLVESAGVWTEKVTHRFDKAENGEIPLGALIEDTSGNFYGTTGSGGAYGHGVAFELLHTKKGGWREKVLYSFCVTTGCPDGADPVAGLAWGPSYNTIYGTTEAGGITNCGGGAGCGTVFSLSNSSGVWSEAVVYSFQGRPDGVGPFGPVVVDGSGNLYGATTSGGTYNFGTIWEITP